MSVFYRNAFLSFAFYCLSAKGEETIMYRYDQLSRVTNAVYSSGGSIYYTYDKSGNRTLLSIIAPNRPPLAINDSLQCPINQSVKVTSQKLLANDSDPDGDPLTFVGANPISTQGGSVVLTGPWVIYNPPADFNGTDTFTYSISDGRGGNATGTVTVKIQTSTLSNQPNSTKISNLSNGNKQAHFVGIPGFTYTIQASTDLITWVTIGNAQADNLGDFQLEDTDSHNQPIRFYRSVYP